jgi:hypothetical protein
MIKKLTLSILVILIAMPISASANQLSEVSKRPYWYQSIHTYQHGWIIKAGNNSRIHTIRTTCHWSANGWRWHVTWRIGPGESAWTTSDAGRYGDFRPYALDCSYIILW